MGKEPAQSSHPADPASTATESGQPVFHCKLAPIRLGEFDIGTVLYHGRYFHLLEEIRENFLRTVGLPYPELVRSSLHLAVTESRQNFHAPIGYGDEVEANLRFNQVRRTSFNAIYELFVPARSPKPVHQAETKHVCVSVDSARGFRVTHLPEKLLEELKRFTV